jgi:site-specific recombinase XerD
VRILYGCGLRVSEPLNLRIKDIDLENSRLVIREAKRNKDRVVALECSLVSEIQEQLRIARRFYELDHERNIPVPLPGLLAKKYRSAPLAWQWYWLFPSKTTCLHPRTGETVRWRMHEANVQMCVREAARIAGLDGAITPHNLRHAYATHLMDRGVNMKSLAEAMGHESIETTAGYCHASALSVPSPLALL